MTISPQELLRLIKEAGGAVTDAIVVEIGSGWRPFIPIIFRLCGARTIHTFDVNPWMDGRYVVETYMAVRSRLPEIAHHLQIDLDQVRSRFPAILPRKRHWRDTLKLFNVDYRCPADARCTGLESESVDLVISSNVLEHIPPSELEAIHRESWRILVPGGLAVHRFNPEDHFATVDKRVTRANFLRYSTEQWHRIAGGLAFHNRLRCPQHSELLESAGFDILVARTRIDQPSLEAIRTGRLPVHPDFAGFSPEELAADYMWLVGQRPLQTREECQQHAHASPCASAKL